jgi:magnesium and cobalt transporter
MEDEPPDHIPVPAGINRLSQQLIANIVELNGTTVKEIMIPRIDMVTANVEDPVEKIISEIHTSGHSRIPINGKSIDEIVGILYAKDLLPFFNRPSELDLKEVLRPVFFVPETKRITSLLEEFQAKKTHMAIIIDEYGGVAGLVTLEDVLEEIVGEIQDEFDEELEESCIQLSDHSYLVDTRLTIEELNDELDMQIDDDENDTLGGYIYSLFGKVPDNHEKITQDHIEYEVMEIEGNRITKVKISLVSPETNLSDAEKLNEPT